MTARRRSTKRTAPAFKRVPWAEPFPQFFRLASSDWSPPKEVVIRLGSRTWTYLADFTMSDGHPVRLTVRIDPVRKAVLDERMEILFRMKGGAK